ncbi:MAG: hypothetical protein R3Y04_04325 [Rikenellaceae bacterium]
MLEYCEATHHLQEYPQRTKVSPRSGSDEGFFTSDRLLGVFFSELALSQEAKNGS